MHLNSVNHEEFVMCDNTKSEQSTLLIHQWQIVRAQVWGFKNIGALKIPHNDAEEAVQDKGLRPFAKPMIDYSESELD